MRGDQKVDDAPLLAVMPMWQGEPPPAQIIATHKFAGNGDVLALCRYLPLLTGAGYRASFRCKRPGFRRLLEYSLNEPSASFPGGQELPWQIPLHYCPRCAPPGRSSRARSRRMSRQSTSPSAVTSRIYRHGRIYTLIRGGWHTTGGGYRRVLSVYVGPLGYYDENRGSRKLRPLKTMALRDMEPIYHAHPCVNLQVGVDRTRSRARPVIDVLVAES